MQVLTGTDFKNMLLAAEYRLTQDKERVNALNVFPVPDGDTGTNMALTFSAAVRELDKLDAQTIDKISSAVARGSLMGARGNSGVILSQFFRGLSDGLKKVKEASSADLARALKSASETTYRAVMKPVEGTILTVAKAAAEGAEQAAEQEKNVVETWEAALIAAQRAVADTPKILPVLKQAGVVDAGGEGLAVILQGALSGLKGEAPVIEDRQETEQVSRQEGITRIEGVLKNKYCTEFLVRGENLDVKHIRETLDPQGDSMLVVGDATLVKIHIHTDHPGKVLEFCGSQGDLVDIKIDNMKMQNENITESPNMADNEEHKVINFPNEQHAQQSKSLGVVAVVPGAELADIFRSLGVDYVVAGGQTMNPSTEELVRAVEAVNAESVIILPNNKNVIFSSQQVKELVEKEVGVVATRSVPQGIGALMQLDPESSLTENLAAMEDGMRQVKTGEVTYAVRATKAGDLQIEEQDIIGLAEGKISCVGQSVSDVTMSLLSEMVDEESSIISIYTGDNQDFSEAEEFASKVEEEFPECEVELYKGGQPLYYYILSVE